MTESYEYMIIRAEARANPKALMHSTNPVSDEWDFVCITFNGGSTFLVFRKNADD